MIWFFKIFYLLFALTFLYLPIWTLNLESQILNLQSNNIYFALMIKIYCEWNLRRIKTTNPGNSYCYFHIILYKLKSFIFLKPATHQVLEHHERVH